MSATTTTLETAAAARSGLRSASSNRRRVVRRLLREPIGLAAMGLVLGMIALALLAPLLSLDDPLAQNLDQGFQGTGSTGHWLGTDLYGRDILSRVIWGARASLAVGFVATCIALSIGVTLGVIVGYYGGAFDMIAMRVVDVMLAFPYLLLAIVIVGAFGPGLFNAVIAVAITPPDDVRSRWGHPV